MKRNEAQISLDLYKSFVSQTQAVNVFLENAKQFQVLLSVEVPILTIVRFSFFFFVILFLVFLSFP